MSAELVPDAVQVQLDPDVGFLRRANDAGGAAHADSDLLQAREEPVDLVLGAGGDPQGVGDDGGEIADQDAAIQQRLPHLAASPGGREQHEVGVRWEDRDAVHGAELAEQSVALCSDRVEDRHRLAGVMQRGDACRLRERRHVVRQPHTLDVVDDGGLGRHVPEAGTRHREGLRERAHHRDVGLVGDQLQRALAAELDVGLVDDDQRIALGREPGDRIDRLGVARRVVGRAHEHDVGGRANAWPTAPSSSDIEAGSLSETS